MAKGIQQQELFQGLLPVFSASSTASAILMAPEVNSWRDLEISSGSTSNQPPRSSGVKEYLTPAFRAQSMVLPVVESNWTKMYPITNEDSECSCVPWNSRLAEEGLNDHVSFLAFRSEWDNRLQAWKF